MTHTNSTTPCPGCLAKFNAYPNFYLPLQQWFFSIQSKYPDFHIAEAGRGKIEQELYYARGVSNAQYGQSAHNWNCAIDTFFQDNGHYSVDASRYKDIFQSLDSSVKWYGTPDAVFKETPHFEWASWRDLRDDGTLKLVE